MDRRQFIKITMAAAAVSFLPCNIKTDDPNWRSLLKGAKLEIFSGARPEGRLLVSVPNLPYAEEDGILRLTETVQSNHIADGVAGWFRLRSHDGKFEHTGHIGTCGTEMILGNISFVTGDRFVLSDMSMVVA